MSMVPVKRSICNRKTPQNLILELKALQKSDCVHLCQDTTLQKSKINAEGRKINLSPLSLETIPMH